MRRMIVGALFASVLAAPVAAQTVVNIDGTANASLDGSNAVTASFGAGTYRYTFTQGAFTAFSRFSGENGCDAAGGNCVQGFENSARLIINGVTTLFGDGAASGGIGPQTATGGYYDSADRSFAAAGKYVGTFTLTSPADVRFFIYDDYLGDNRGGISLSVAGVPEPATWALMILGFGAVGGAMRRRSAVRTAVSFA